MPPSFERIARLERLATGRSVLVALHTLCLAAAVGVAARMTHERAVLQAIVDATGSPEMDEAERALALMHVTNRLLRESQRAIGARQRAPASGVLGYMDTLDHVITPVGGCGSFTRVLVMVLRHADIDARVLQMMCEGGTSACHVMLEAHLNGRWVALDPLYDLAFRRPDGRLASFADVQADWGHYRSQVDERGDTSVDYPVHVYDYGDVRYTNWHKVPVLLPALRAVLGGIMGPAVDTVSLRTLGLDVNRLVLIGLGLAYVLLVAWTLRAARRHRTPSDGGDLRPPAGPTTASPR